jgi:hypothetical protein
MTSKSRKTQIVAHKSKKALETIFPDMTINRYLSVYDNQGEVLDRFSYSPGNSRDEMVKKYAELAGYVCGIEEENYQYRGYITLPDGQNLSITSLGERKVGIQFTSNKDEAEHYEDVDKIVKQLALEDVAVLRGECEITITTRC